MSDENVKPREFWMNRRNVELNASPVFSASCHVRYYPQEEYAKLHAENERLRSDLKKISSGWECSACSCCCHDVAKKALSGKGE